MTANTHLFPQLDAFAALPKPGFALMVDAPWGVGKSHALRKWMSLRKDCLYVSLYGAVDSAAIEDALFDALLAMNKALKPPVGLSTAASLSEKWTGVRIDLTGAYRRQALRSLPNVLIFDDLERTDMTPNQLLGRLNQFVEHDRRNVILVAHQDKLRLMSNGPHEDYDSIREKVIGRSIAMMPETDVALAAFLVELCRQAGGLGAKTKALLGNAKSRQKLDASAFLKREKEILLSVFGDSATQNLRLLRQAMLEFARFHGQLPLHIKENTQGMQHLLATFVTLSVAYHGGNSFTSDDLNQESGWSRALWAVNGQKDPEPPKTGIELLQEYFQENRYARLDGTVMTGSLARALIGDGYAQDAFIATELQKAPFFAIQHSEAWQTLWWWPKRSEAEVSEALKQVKHQLEKLSFRDEVVILHLGGILLDLADNCIGWNTREGALQEMLNYISQIEIQKLLPSDRPKGGYSLSFRDGNSFGLEIKQQKTTEFTQIHDTLIDALDRRFWAESQTRAQELLDLAKADPESFVAVLDNSGRREGLPNYAHWPVMTGSDPTKAVQAIFSLPQDQIWQVLTPFKDRIKRLEAIASQEQNTTWPNERDWLISFRAEADRLAGAASNPIRTAQIRTLLHRNLGFLDEE